MRIEVTMTVEVTTSVEVSAEAIVEGSTEGIRIMALRPGESITGVLAGVGPRVTLRRKDINLGQLGYWARDEDQVSRVDTVLIQGVGDAGETVALLLTDRLGATIGAFTRSPGYRPAMRMTLCSDSTALPSGARVGRYAIRPADDATPPTTLAKSGPG
jgi:glutamate dehydrogenase/leucine dehydrogenase